MRLRLWITAFVGSLASVAAAAAPPARPLGAELMAKRPVDLMPADPAASMTFRDATDFKPAATAAWTGAGDAAVLRVETFNQPKSTDHVDVKWAIAKPIRRGDVMLARFFARALSARQESGEAMFELNVMQSTPEFARHVLLPLTAGPEWTLLEVPFVAARDADVTQGQIHLAFGTIPQAVEVAGLQILNFEDRAKASELPQTRLTYKGREANAAWRTAALARIEQTRTAPMKVRVIDAVGRPVPDASVEVRLVRPAFLFGTAVDPDLLLEEGEANAKFRATLLDLFDTAVIGNGMKWPRWSGSVARRDEALRAIDWLEQHGLRVRGHNLVWPGDKFSPKRIQQMPPPRAELPLLIKEHIRDIVTSTRGRIVGWDVVNEMTHERDYFKTMPELEAAEWFKLARELDPAAKLVLNEYGMLNSPRSPGKIAEHVALADRLRKAGAPIDILGVQGHIGRQPRGPEDVLADLDILAASGLEVQITEFDVNTPDEQLQADYTRDFLIALYSHPCVTGFTMWGFWEGRHWKPDAAMFRTDWSEKPNAKAWRDLARGAWLTKVDAKTDADGRLSTRGHLGDYEFTVTANGKVDRERRPLTKAGADVTIQMP